MSDDLSIPSPTYRVPRHGHGIDPGTLRLAVIAAGIGLGLVVIIGGWHVFAHRHHGVPVVMAEPGPLRVKPANPGGLQVAGVGNDIFSGGNDTNVERLAPPPQTPDPQALQAMVPPKPEPAPASIAHPATIAAPPPALVAREAPAAHEASAVPAAREAPAAADRVAREAASIPARTPAPAAAKQAVAAVTPLQHRDDRSATTADQHQADARHVSVQLAALSSEQAARDEWARLVRRWPDLFGGRHPAFSKVAHDGHVFWRVRTSGFDGVSAATMFCERLRAKGAGCSVADF